MTIWKKYPAAVNWNVSADGLLFGFLVGLNEIVMMSLKLFCFILLRFYDTIKIKKLLFWKNFFDGPFYRMLAATKLCANRSLTGRVPLSAKIACLVEASCVLSLPELNLVVYCFWTGEVVLLRAFMLHIRSQKGNIARHFWKNCCYSCPILRFRMG